MRGFSNCHLYFRCVLLGCLQAAVAQQTPGPSTNSNGVLLAQNDPAIEQARLFQRPAAVTNSGVTADGMALGEATPSTDDSFGDQVILKSQPRPRLFTLTGDATIFYTDNVALTRRGTRDDTFFVIHAGGSWTPHLGPNLDGQIGASVSTFRYNDTSALDFTNLGFGTGLFWNPPSLHGIGVFARYDFIELLNRHGNEILQDHEFTLGAQKVFALGRSHAITIGGTAMAGISDPRPAQRDQVGMFVGYQLQLTRTLDTEISYRPAVHFYNSNGRVDLNQVVSWNLRYRITPWAEANGFLSFGSNRSDRSVFDYDVFTAGAGVAVPANSEPERHSGNYRRGTFSALKTQRIFRMRLIILPFLALAFLRGGTLAAAPLQRANVTKIINDVQVFDPAAGPHRATLNELIVDDLGLRTGIKSRSELVFEDQTLTRLGPESYFSFKPGTRDMMLERGTMLLQVPKGLGGATIRTSAITASITGTTILLEYLPEKYVKVLVLEGSLRLSINGVFGSALLLHPGKW